jgi:hypothetical protein
MIFQKQVKLAEKQQEWMRKGQVMVVKFLTLYMLTLTKSWMSKALIKEDLLESQKMRVD